MLHYFRYGARSDCGVQYKCQVDLLNKDKLVLDRLRFEDTKPAKADWYQVSYMRAHILLKLLNKLGKRDKM